MGQPPRTRLGSARGLLIAGLLILATAASSAHARSSSVKQAQRGLKQVVSQPVQLPLDERQSLLDKVQNTATQDLVKYLLAQVKTFVLLLRHLLFLAAWLGAPVS